MATSKAAESGRSAKRPGESIVSRRNRVLGPAYRLFYERPVHLVRGSGVWLYDSDGKQYLDVYNNVACVGHCHPHVVKALADQAALLNTHTRYLHETILDYAEKLLGCFPADLDQVMFACTGSEANDLALRIAREYSGGQGLIITQTAYHGSTVAMAEASPSLGQSVKLGEHVRTVPPPDSYRGDEEGIGQRFARDVAKAIASLRDSKIEPAAILLDSIFSSDGVFSHPKGVINAAVEMVRKAGGVFIADEVQPGFGRTGDGMWGFQRHGIVPDLVTLGKPMGNGHPLAGVVAKSELLAPFAARSRYFNTFGGNPVSSAVGIAVLEVIEREELVENAREVGAELSDGLKRVANRYEIIGDIRGAGLFLGVEIVRDRRTREPDTNRATRLVNAMRDRHVLIGASGANGNCLKIRPPLCFSGEHVEAFLSRFESALAEISRD